MINIILVPVAAIVLCLIGGMIGYKWGYADSEFRRIMEAPTIANEITKLKDRVYELERLAMIGLGDE